MRTGTSPQHRAHRVNALGVAAVCAAALAACAVGRVDSQVDMTAASDDSGSTAPADGSATTPDASMPVDKPDTSTPVGPPDASPLPDTGVPAMLEASTPDATASETSAPAEASAPETSTAEASIPEASTPEASTPETSTGVSCVPAPNNDTLPFAVDAAGNYVPSGYEGNVAAITMPFDPTCGGNRASASAMGSCHPVTFTPPAAGSTAPNWSGVLWQHPLNNWGTAAGYAMPAGATKVSFWARGELGGEVLTFLVGFAVTPTATAPCVDTVSGSLRQSLGSTWTHFTIPLNGQYTGGIISPFGYVISAADQPSRPGGVTTTTFYVDDIEWQ